MFDILTAITTYFQQLPWLELIAMLLSLAYVILAARGSLWCWPAAFISTALYTYIFYDVLLLMDSVLNAYYLLMAVYGYWIWSKTASDNKRCSTLTNTKENSEENTVNNDELNIVSWHWQLHTKICLMLILVSAGLGYVMSNFTHADFAYLDTFTTVFAIFATYLVANKVLENWLYWIVIDLASIYLYLEKALIPTAVLFVIFVVVACYGYRKWLKLFNNSNITLQSTY